LKKLALVGLAGALAAVGIAAPSIAGGNKYAAQSDPRDCGDGDSVVLNGPLKLWPPNHKMIDEPVTATDADGSGPVTLTLRPLVTDAAGGDGGSAHDPDFNPATEGDETLVATDENNDGVAVAGLQLRAERSGKGEGRTYTVHFTADFGDKECTSEDGSLPPFTITVPHDMGAGNDAGRNGSKDPETGGA
jgi:hypothetical protein